VRLNGSARATILWWSCCWRLSSPSRHGHAGRTLVVRRARIEAGGVPGCPGARPDWSERDLAKLTDARTATDAEVAARAQEALRRIESRRKMGRRLVTALPDFDSAVHRAQSGDILRQLRESARQRRADKLSADELSTLAALARRSGTRFEFDDIQDLIWTGNVRPLVELYATCLDHPEEGVRASAAGNLRASGYRRFAGDVLRVVRDAQGFGGLCGMEAFWEIGATECLPDVVELLKHADAGTRSAAREILLRMRPPPRRRGCETAARSRRMRESQGPPRSRPHRLARISRPDAARRGFGGACPRRGRAGNAPCSTMHAPDCRAIGSTNAHCSEGLRGSLKSACEVSPQGHYEHIQTHRAYLLCQLATDQRDRMSEQFLKLALVVGAFRIGEDKRQHVAPDGGAGQLSSQWMSTLKRYPAAGSGGNSTGVSGPSATSDTPCSGSSSPAATARQEG